jgi:hypothetical protein
VCVGEVGGGEEDGAQVMAAGGTARRTDDGAGIGDP